jgi:hypothetical protein
MKDLKKALPGLGFKPITANVFACRGGELVHAVIIGKDRYGSDVVSVLVFLASFFEGNGPLAREHLLQSPLLGDISPRGVVSTGVWEKGTLAPVFAEEMIKTYFREFATPADVRRALDDLYVAPYFETLMTRDVPMPAHISALPAATYDVVGGALSLNETRQAARKKLGAALVPLGFTLPDCIDVVAVRRRADMFDAVTAVLDTTGTFVTLICFPWTPVVWQADKNWKGTYYPMVPYTVMKDDAPLVLARQAFVDMDPALLRDLVGDGIRRSSDIADHLQFADQLDASFTTMAGKLRRIPL